ncbi:MAG: helix-hairpin-helix domain-containing protein [Chloroflexi bacterium]|nr:helix-hairpin-helix domain-containing protein [Chloroflexota bacterium]
MNEALARYRPYLAMMFLFLIVLIGTIFFLRRAEPTALAISTPTPRSTATPASITVDVRGAVNKPGVYTLALGSRVQEALTLAGDATNAADLRPLNLARKLNDGEQLYIPVLGEAPPTSAPASAKGTPTIAKSPGGKINLNTATLPELDTLPGIGPAIAQRILDYRQQNGAFAKIEDIKKVRGIGDAMFDQIKDLITTQ